MFWKFLLLPVIVFVVISGCVSETTPALGTIQFTSSPTGAEIYLDSQFRGTTPSTLTAVEPATYTLELRSPGYQSWSGPLKVSAGQNSVFVVMASETSSGTSPVAGQTIVTAIPTSSQVSVTLNLGREQMIIGDSMTFSGTATGCSQVLLTLYGPGAYTNGVFLASADVNSLGAWSYTWNPGTKILSGTYTIVANDPQDKVTEQKKFTVYGGGQVTVVPNSYSAARGDTLTFSGLCTTGTPSVRLVLYGPDRYAGGIELATISVMANNNWNFAYTLDSTMPTGVYTIYAYDVPKTTSGTAQFTVGYAS